MLSAVVTQMRGEMRTEIRELRVEGAVAAEPSLLSASSDSRFQTWMWGGRMHMVPEGWTLPFSINLKDTWHLWHFGHIAHRIGPLRSLRKFDLASAPQVTLWSKTKQTMGAVAQEMVDMEMVTTVQATLTLSGADSTAFFDRAIVGLMEKLKVGVTQGRRRWMEMKIPTVYALLLKHGSGGERKGRERRKRRGARERRRE
jgi:hypothetical protein